MLPTETDRKSISEACEETGHALELAATHLETLLLEEADDGEV